MTVAPVLTVVLLHPSRAMIRARARRVATRAAQIHTKAWNASSFGLIIAGSGLDTALT